MRMGEAIKIAFLPQTGTAIYLAINAVLFLVGCLFIEPQPFWNILSATLGCVLLALAGKLYIGVFFGLTFGIVGDDPPRGSMLLMAVILHICSGAFIFPFLIEYGRLQGIPLE